MNTLLNRAREAVERELHTAVRELDDIYLCSVPARFRRCITAFLLRQGKRIRPVLLILAFRGYAPRSARNLYRAAVAMEFLHEFILIHDDIIDHSSLRRGLPALQGELQAELAKLDHARFTGIELAMLVGDMMYAMAMNLVLEIGVSPERKQRALRLLTRSAFETGCGEINELLLGLVPIGHVSPSMILDIYDQKTSHYSFVCPLVMGATLAGASSGEIGKLTSVGLLAGRAFQIDNDVEDLESEAVSSIRTEYTDLREGKKTLPLRLAYDVAPPAERKELERVLSSKRPRKADLARAAEIIERTGGIEGARREAARFMQKARTELAATRLRAPVRAELDTYLSALLRH